MRLVFLEPASLWLLGLLPLLWFLPRRAPDQRHALVRAGMVAMMILALARPALLQPQGEAFQVLIWDRSESVPSEVTRQVEQRLVDLIDAMPDPQKTRIITLGDRPSRTNAVAGLDNISLPGSSLSLALETAARLIPDKAQGAITLFTDGLATDPDWGDAVKALAERGIPVHALWLLPVSSDIYPAAVRVVPPIRVGQTARVEVEVVGTAEEMVVSLLSGGERLASSGPITGKGRTTARLEFEPERVGLLEVSAQVQVRRGTDSRPGNNTFVSALAVQEPIRALYLSERLANSRAMFGRLIGRGVDLVEPSLARLEQMARAPESLRAFDLVIIDDRPAESIPLALQEAVVHAVREDGIGLFYAGGKGVFGTGGYFDTPMASILPVEILQKEEKRDPSTTLVVIIDTSGSMSGERVQLAKECARLAIRRLLPHDKVGIVEFYGTKQWAAPIQSAANAIEIQRALNRLDAGGGTVILPAIEEAFYALQNVQTRYKHVLVLTDGGVEAGDFETLMRRMAAKGINVSTVLVGGHAHSEFLVNLANWGKGHFYNASSRFSIPEILFKQPSTSKIPPYRPGRHPVRFEGSSSWWGDIAPPESPSVMGYVETRLRPGADRIVATEPERHPVLSSWRFGLGRVSALATEPVGGGTEPWQAWEGYGAWLLRVLSRTAREHSQPFAYSVDRTHDQVRILARRLTSHAHDPRAILRQGDGETRSLVFRQRSPDLFTATRSVPATETLWVQAGAEGWTGPKAHLASPAWQAAAPEHNVDPHLMPDPARLAAATGGEAAAFSDSAGFWPARGPAGGLVELQKLWPWCLLLALITYLADILYRRWPGRVVE